MRKPYNAARLTGHGDAIRATLGAGSLSTFDAPTGTTKKNSASDTTSAGSSSDVGGSTNRV